MFDILIKNGTIIDGTGQKGYEADILIKDGKIVRLGTNIDEECREIIDAKGLHVSPGFIDAHTHSDLAAIHNRQHPHALTQGITTEVSGLCGLGFAPMPPDMLDNYIRFSSGIFGNVPAVDYRWNSFGEYLARMDGYALNSVCAVTHNALRILGSGFSNVKLEGEALEKAKAALRQAFEEGAVGFSTGLSYYPCAWSDTEELIEFCKIVKEYDGIFLVHKRLLIDDLAYDDNAEVCAIARATGVRTHVLHYKTGLSNAGKPESLFVPYQQAIDDGLDFSFEFYPYHAGCGFGLVFIPAWAQEGGYYSIMERLADTSLREKLKADALRYYDVFKPQDGLQCVFTHVKNHDNYAGVPFSEVAKERGQDIVDMILDVLLESELEFGFRGSETQNQALSKTMYDDMMALIDHPLYTIGSDAIPLGDYPNPRLFGTFTRMLRMVREYGYPLEKYVQKVTSYTASRFNIVDRGTLAEGKIADVTIFDFENVRDMATFEHPRRCSEGIKYVIVNGKIAVWDEKVTGILAGKALQVVSKNK